IQFLFAVGATSVILSAANGADIRIISLYSRSPKAFRLLSSDAAIAAPADLRGKTIVGPAGTILHELLVSYLASANMTLADVNFVDMTIPNAMAALTGGSADAA
ncbi:MAG: ABC transporter substrate-binding protein, partial [Clostridia bacterium]